ncbi:PREDICTED: lamin-like protein [Nelumbo nucifera]|uniref:Phytocyanin domain-containing protein n=2 Tax=Nelumbo nucifera TaxID=4432 RepID=A0A822YB74_NELNU|nr:PREDICTED: lamin-like protein [Nelumbo nucifera]DAD31364.1 TPA_asm: hypothetical protein HUJ06_010215 [Nelumbo nucifera]
MGAISRRALLQWMILLMIVCIGRVSGKMLRVGGSSQGWNPDVNYTEWASKQYFYVGLWLYFGYDRYYYNVLEVNETSYETCNDRDPITNVTRGAGRDVFNLTEAKTYYFLSSGGYCWHGMKLAVPVHQFPLPPPVAAPSPSSSTKSSSTSSSPSIILPAALVLAVTWTINSLFSFR